MVSRLASSACLLFLVACADEPPRVAALVAPDRSAHLLDRPFPSDELRTARGTVALDGMPMPRTAIGRTLLRGWIAQVAETCFGFSALTPVFFRFSGPIEVDAEYASAPADPIRLYSLDSDHEVRVVTRFVASADGDPFFRDHVLWIAPDEATPLRAGERYAAVVSTAIADRAPGWTPPAELADRPDLAVGTVFTVADSTAELRSLIAVADLYLSEDHTLLNPGPPGLREVSSVRYELGETPRGEPATREIVAFADGTSEVTFLDDKSGLEPRTIDLTAGPYRVLQVAIRTVAFQDPAGKPWQGAGFDILNDAARTDGWLRFDAEHRITAVPGSEEVRVVVQVPRDPRGRAPLLLWGHGSGGDAYEAISRVDPEDRILALREVLAAAGVVIVSHDMPLFGRRFELIDRGYSSNQAFINVGNLPVFRDNPRQAVVDHRTVYRFSTEVLPGLLGAEVPIDTRRVIAFGHSTGAQVGGLAAAAYGEGALAGLILSGGGGFLSHYVVASDLLAIQADEAAVLFALAGVAAPDPITPPALLGAVLGIPEPVWGRIERHHPMMIPFQLVLDGADVLSVAPDQRVPTLLFVGAGDRRAPNDATEWTGRAMRRATLAPCTPGGAYDGHYCALRETFAHEQIRDFVEEQAR